MSENSATPQSDAAVQAIRARIDALIAARAARVKELERLMRGDLQQFDLAINELNSVLKQLGQKTVDIAAGVNFSVPVSKISTREQAVAAFQPAAILKRRMGKK